MAEGVPTNNQRGQRSGPCRLWRSICYILFLGLIQFICISTSWSSRFSSQSKISLNSTGTDQSQHTSIKWNASKSFVCMGTCKYRKKIRIFNIRISNGTPLSHLSVWVHVNTERRSESQHTSIKWYTSESFLCMCTCKYRKKIRITTYIYQMVHLWVIPLYVYM